MISITSLILECIIVTQCLFRRKRRKSYYYDCVLILLVFHVTGSNGNSLRGGPGNHLKGEEFIVVETGKHDSTTKDGVIPVATATFPISAKQGTHHLHIYIGSPPQRQTLIIDTGSRLMAFPCEPCDDCGTHITPSYFDPQRSSTTIQNTCDNQSCKIDSSTCFGSRCEFNQRYMEGSSFKAYEMEDIVWIGSDNMVDSIEQHMQFSVPFSFGCLLSETGLFKTQHADGIMGLAKSDISFINELYHSGSIIHHGFSICMTRYNGYLSIGGTPFSYPSMYHLEPMTFIPSISDNTKNDAFYRVGVTEVKLGNVKITTKNSLIAFNRHKGTIIDSGTSDTYLPLLVSAKFKAIWAWLTGFQHSNSMRSFTYKEFNALPDVVITLSSGYEWIVEPKAYMEESQGLRDPKWQIDTIEPWEGTLVFSNRIYLNEEKGCVLGANAMSGHDILFEQNRIGIARANCKMA